jgi:hypothetical protein
MKEALAEKRRMTPTTGFNVVGVDDFELPGEKLYLIGHYKSEPEAEAAKARHEKEHPDETVHIYSAR